MKDRNEKDERILRKAEEIGEKRVRRGLEEGIADINKDVGEVVPVKDVVEKVRGVNRWNKIWHGGRASAGYRASRLRVFTNNLGNLQIMSGEVKEEDTDV